MPETEIPPYCGGFLFFRFGQAQQPKSADKVGFFEKAYYDF